MKKHKATLLLVTHVTIRQGPHGPQIDDQTAAGIAQWCKHFDRVTYYGIAEDLSNTRSSSSSWVSLIDNQITDRCELLTLPRAYRVNAMLKEYRSVRAQLRQAVSTHRHLCFTVGGLVGDWPALGAREAIRQQRRYSAWIDRVESSVLRNKVSQSSLKRRILAEAIIPFMEHNTRYIVKNSSASLLQGLDTFEHYAKFSTNPHCTYDTHSKISDEIAPDILARKLKRILDAFPIRLVYVGRAAAMKGPEDWLDTLKCLQRQMVPFQATWIGDGPELEMMKQRLVGSPIAHMVHLPGFENDREALLCAMQESDILMFCHKTPESPRCLIEALVSGCALVGYDTAYPRGLTQEKGGGAFTPQHDTVSLACKIAQLHRNRCELAQLVRNAAASGKLYNEDAVYEHRASIMKEG